MSRLTRVVLDVDVTRPSTPTGLFAAAAGQTQINLTWTASTDPSVTGQATTGVAGYRVYRSSTKNGTYTLRNSTTGTSYSDTGLAAAQTWYYKVSAYDGAATPNESVLSSAVNATTAANTNDPTAFSLLQQSDITYLGSFQLSLGGANSAFDNGGAGMSVNGTTMYLAGNLQQQTLGRIAIPNAPFTGQMTTVISQPVSVPGSAGGTGGSQYQTGSLVYNGRLIVQKAASYDANHDSNLVFTAGSLTVSGFSAMQSASITGGGDYRYYNGCMAVIPPEWRTLFGGPALCGNGTQSNNATCSWGPACGVFDPDTVDGSGTVPVQAVIHYPISNPIQGYAVNRGTSSTVYTSADQFMAGMAFPSGRRTVIFIGRHGTGAYDYKNESGGPDDPCDSSNAGEQAYPYELKMWLYDANEMLQAKNGQRQPYSVQPYAVLSMTPPNMTICAYMFMGMATYDDTTRRIYATERDGWPANTRIHVWQVAA